VTPFRRAFALLACAMAAATFALAGGPPADASTDTVTRYGGLSFGAPMTIDPEQSGVRHVSCASTTSCVAVDTLGSAMVLTGSTWSAPQQFDPLPDYAAVEAVSCPSTTLCVAVDGLGQASSYDGASWSEPTQADDLFLSSISCPTQSFCVATDGAGRAITFDGTDWSAPTTVTADGAPITGVSCSSTTFCMALDLGEQQNVLVAEKTYRYDGESWTQAGGKAPAQAKTISCVSPTFCMASNGQSAATFDGTTWSAPVDVASYYALGEVSCPSATFCLMGDVDGNAYTYDGNTWSPPQLVNPADGLRSTSCVSVTHCVAVGVEEAITYDSGDWSEPTSIDHVQGGLGQVSCPSRGFCLAIDSHGNYLTLDGGTWSAPMDIGFGVGSVSCVSADFCAATSGQDLVTYDGQSWSATEGLQSNPNTAFGPISCTSPTFCLAISANGGQAAAFDGSTWKVVANPGSGESGASLSCAAPTYCVAIFNPQQPGLPGYGHVFDGARWEGLPQRPRYGSRNDVSCPTATFCMVITGRAHAWRLHGATWARAGHISGGGPVSCLSRHFCAVSTGFYDGHQWSVPLPGIPSAWDISCAARDYCVGVGGAVAFIGGRSDVLTVTARARIRRGHHARIKTTLTDPATGKPIKNATVVLWARTSVDRPFVRVGKAETSRYGHASRRVAPDRTTTYEWVYAAGAGHPSALSAMAKVRVRR
jgi:hypothetical protein